MKQYLDMVRYVIDNGEFRDDRTGTGTLSVFGYQFRHDLNKGFPLLTTKKMPFRIFAEELKWMLQSGNNLKQLLDKNVNFWNSDCYRWYKANHPNDDISFEEFIEKCKVDERYGDLGTLYGYQWASWEAKRKPIKVEPRIKEKQEIKQKEVKLLKPIGNDELIGRTFKNKNKDKFIVVEFQGINKNKHKKFKIQFVKTGYIVNDVDRCNILQGNIKDRYSPNVYGVGYIGNEHRDTELKKHLYEVWKGMLLRCYYIDAPSYKNYGAKGVFVEDRWHNFSNFYQDVQKLPNWNRKIREWDKWQLDKDYYSSNCYSKNTCVWITKGDNVLYRKSKAFKVTTPNGNEFIEISVPEISRSYNLDESAIYKVLKGKYKTHHGFKFEYIEDGELYRYPLPINQVQDVINQIKNNPTSRRILWHGWNVAENDDMCLPNCHTLYQFYVSKDRKLSLQMYQRSGDLFLGVPANIMNCALLTHLIAEHCNLDVGEIIINFGDLHIYNNHLPQVIEQLQREPRELPELIIRQDLTLLQDISDFELSSISVLGYNPHPTIKGKLSVGTGK